MTNTIYIRTSTEEQNPENQIKDILSLMPDNSSYQVIEDRQSAFKDVQRDGFDKVLSRIKQGTIKDLYVWDLDRIYRNRLKLVGFFQLCKAYKVNIHSYRQDWLESLNKTPAPWNEIMSELMIQLMGWMAEDESKKKSERVKAAVRKKGDKTVSYKGNRWGRKPLPKQTRDRILDLHKQGKSMRQIAKEVCQWVNGNQKPISHVTVMRVLQNSQPKNPKENIVLGDGN